MSYYALMVSAADISTALGAAHLLQLYSIFVYADGFAIVPIAIPGAKFLEAKSDYLAQLSVTPEMVAKKIKVVKDNKSAGVDGIPPLLMETATLVHHLQECSTCH